MHNLAKNNIKDLTHKCPKEGGRYSKWAKNYQVV